MSDYDDDYPELTELYQQVVQAELQMITTIDEDGAVEFTDSELGTLKIPTHYKHNLQDMELFCRLLTDTNGAHAHEDLFRICNSVNRSCGLAKLTASFGDGWSTVNARISLVLAVPDRMPDEVLLRTVIVRAMSSMKAAAKKFTDELQKLDSAPTA